MILVTRAVGGAARSGECCPCIISVKTMPRRGEAKPIAPPPPPATTRLKKTDALSRAWTGIWHANNNSRHRACAKGYVQAECVSIA